MLSEKPFRLPDFSHTILRMTFSSFRVCRKNSPKNHYLISDPFYHIFPVDDIRVHCPAKSSSGYCPVPSQRHLHLVTMSHHSMFGAPTRNDQCDTSCSPGTQACRGIADCRHDLYGFPTQYPSGQYLTDYGFSLRITTGFLPGETRVEAINVLPVVSMLIFLSPSATGSIRLECWRPFGSRWSSHWSFPAPIR